MIKQVESPQTQHSATRISSGRGRDWAQQLQLSMMRETSTTWERTGGKKTRCTGLRD